MGIRRTVHELFRDDQQEQIDLVLHCAGKHVRRNDTQHHHQLQVQQFFQPALHKPDRDSDQIEHKER